MNIQDEKAYTPLIIACYNNQYEAAKLLLNAGANINAADYGGNTALMGASFKGYVKIALGKWCRPVNNGCKRANRFRFCRFAGK